MGRYYDDCEECYKKRAKYKYKEEHEEKDNEKDKEHKAKKCKGCVCDQFTKLHTGTEVDLFLNGGTRLEDLVFVTFDPNNCCAFFCDNSEEPGTVVIVDCQDVQAFRIE